MERKKGEEGGVCERKKGGNRKEREDGRGKIKEEGQSGERSGKGKM